MSNYYFYKGNMYSADELQHWKYLRREKINGKWRYFYEDDKYDKLRFDKVSKMSFGSHGNEDYYIKAKKRTSDQRVKVDKRTYDRTKTGTRLYIGNKLASKVAKEQVQMGMSFVKDLLAGNLFRKNRR